MAPPGLDYKSPTVSACSRGVPGFGPERVFMSYRMLIDGTHPEETRVVVLNGNRLEEFDFETSTKTQLKGNIYLAKVTRVEPSLQAAFVDYGGNRHGFLAFSEIHPDYYQIPVADREALLAEEARLQAKAAAEASDEDSDEPDEAESREQGSSSDHDAPVEEGAPEEFAPEEFAPEGLAPEGFTQDYGPARAARAEGAADTVAMPVASDGETHAEPNEDRSERPASRGVETVGGDETEEVERRRVRPHRHYKIQEVIKRRQILLVQVVKEERGNKGAALTTYLSLAGRYAVLMPNTARGGGISRKISDPADRRKLRKVLGELEIPEHMGVIMRTAGVERSKAEIKRDLDFLLRAWDTVRELTLKSTAPCLVYEEGNLIKRAIRDLYVKEIDEVLVEGAEAYQTAKTFMRLLMPSHAKKVQLYRGDIPLFHRFQVEGQLAQMHSPVVQLKSGGYIVINPTEALVAIDVNSGRATRERNIEETATKTNLEAADEIARQLRLRDLAGLVVIDFIDMEEGRNQRAVERRLKEAMKIDRARLQVGRISPFGLLELSRQRLRPSLLEASTEICPYCRGAGHVRSTESTAVHVLRAIEEEGIRHRSERIKVFVPTEVALYILNQKRKVLHGIEARYGFTVDMERDDELIPPDFRLERVKARAPGEGPVPASVGGGQPLPVDEEPEELAEEEAAAELAEGEAAEAEPAAPVEARSAEQGEGRGRRRRRRRGRRGEPSGAPAEAQPAAPEPIAAAAAGPDEEPGEQPPFAVREEPQGDGEAHRRRRGRRGGRRRGRRSDGAEGAETIAKGAPSAPPAVADEVREEPFYALHGPGHDAPWGTSADQPGLGAADESEDVEETPPPAVERPTPDEIPWSTGTPEEVAEPEPPAPPAPERPTPDEFTWSTGAPEKVPAPPAEPERAEAPEPKPEPEPALTEAEREREPAPAEARVSAEPKPARRGWWQRVTR
jgi:ribonuclease E